MIHLAETLQVDRRPVVLTFVLEVPLEEWSALAPIERAAAVQDVMNRTSVRIAAAFDQLSIA